jgi:signal transduction histidine kinase
MTELALRETELDAALKYVATVKQAGANLLSIINDILDFSKIERGHMEIVPGDYLFSSLLNDVISIIRMRVMDSQLRFVVNADSRIPNALYGDELKIRQVLINILGNAVKYTEKGFVSLTICGEMSGADDIILTMEIMDSGRGIKAEDLDKIFGDYIQADSNGPKGIEGVGLGLAIARSIITAMGGEISVESEYGKGSLFTVTLPQKICGKEILALVEKPNIKNILIYEHRKIYANSLICAIDNLGIKCVVPVNDAD